MKAPSLPTIVVGAVLTAVEALNVTTFHFGLPWTIAIGTLIPALAAYGIGPLTGERFQAIIDLTPAETGLAAALFAGLQMAVLKIEMSTGWHAALSALIVVATSLGFGQNAVAKVKGARQAARERWTTASAPSASRR